MATKILEKRNEVADLDTPFPVSRRQKLKIMDRVTNWLRVGFWGTGIIFLWVGIAYYLGGALSRKPAPNATPTLSDLATIFFGASSLALILFSLLLAVAAIIGWQSLKGDVNKTIEEADEVKDRMTSIAESLQERIGNLAQVTEERFDHLETSTQNRTTDLGKELQGRVNTVMGLMIGTLHSDPLKVHQKDEDKDYLQESVYFCQKGYDTLKDLPGNGKYMALNNLVYYSSLLEVSTKHERLLAQGREIKEIAQKYDAGAYLLTYCRVVWQYSSELRELKDALLVAEGLLEMKLTTLQMKEALFLADELRRRIGASSDQTN